MHEEHKEEEHKEDHGEHNHHSEEHKEKKSDTIELNKETVWKVVSGLLGILLILSIFTGGFGIDFTPNNKQAQPSVEIKDAQPRAPSGANPSVDMVALIEDDTIKGDKNAPVTIVEWSDFECPFCTRFYNDAYKQIDKEYIQTGKVKLVYRDFPLGFHQNAQKAAEAAECAGEQGKFWEMHDKLFEEGVSGGVNSFKQFAKSIGLSESKFDKCLDSGEMASEVSKDMQDGQAAGIRGTPGFIINGQLVSGAQPFENFKKVIEAELAK
jgi:protein-disulfide isomerase